MIESDLYRDVIALITDFGARGEHYIASMKAIMLRINPNIQIIDISHHVSSYSILEASYLLKSTYRYFPEFTLFIVVIDPGVGSSRKILAIKSTSNYFFIGPDNGIFPNVLSREDIEECIMITNDNYFNKPVSATFHGRDIMAPVGAYLLSGIPLDNFGPSFNPEEFVYYPINYELLEEQKCIHAIIQYIDSFGNGITNILLINRRINSTSLHIRDGSIIKLELQESNQQFEGIFTSHFANVPINSLLFLEGSSGYLEISINQGNAANALGFKVGDGITITIG